MGAVGTGTLQINIGTPGSPDQCDTYIEYSPVVGAEFSEDLVETLKYVDVTALRSWLPADFDNANLRVLIIGLRGQV